MTANELHALVSARDFHAAEAEKARQAVDAAIEHIEPGLYVASGGLVLVKNEVLMGMGFTLKRAELAVVRPDLRIEKAKKS